MAGSSEGCTATEEVRVQLGQAARRLGKLQLLRPGDFPSMAKLVLPRQPCAHAQYGLRCASLHSLGNQVHNDARAASQ